jgi:hypothetical protein
LKPEWWGSPLVQEEKYQEKLVNREKEITILRDRDSSIRKANERSAVQIPVRVLGLLPQHQSGFGAHPDSYPMGSGDKSDRSLKLATHSYNAEV